MNVLVTGGAGYIGGIVVPILLVEGHSVRVMDNLLHGGKSLLSVWSHQRFEFVRGDIRDQDLVRKALTGIDAVVHLAAIVGDPACAREPELADSVNREASLFLLSHSREAGVLRFVFASTCSNYGISEGGNDLVDETTALDPVSHYAETKVAVERAILETGGDQNPGATVLRFATIFGVAPRLRLDLMVNEFTVKMIANKHLVVFGRDTWRPYIHVVDAARAIGVILATPLHYVRGQVFNVGSTAQNYQKQQIVQMIRPYAPNANVEYLDRGRDLRNYRVCFAKVVDSLGFQCYHSVEDGIREFAHLVETGIVEDYANPEFHN